HVQHEPWRHEDPDPRLRQCRSDHRARHDADRRHRLPDDREHARHRADGSARRAELDRARAHASRHQSAGRSASVTFHVLRAAAVASLIATAVACSRGAPPSPAIVLNTSTPNAAVVEVTGLSSDVAAALEAPRTPEAWASILRVAVSTDAPPVLGSY